MSEVTVNVDRDSSYDFYIAREPVFGKAQVTMPQEFLWRFQRAYDEYQDCQLEMRKYWDRAQEGEG